MKKINTSFSLFDFNKKRADKVQIFGKESLDENGNLIPFIEQAALVTHYLQLKNSKSPNPSNSRHFTCFEFVSSRGLLNTNFVL